MKREKLQREIEQLQEQIRLREEELWDVNELIRVKGPYVRRGKNNYDCYID